MDFIPVVQATALSPSNIVDDAAPTIAASSIISIPEDELNNRNLDQLVKEGYSSGKSTSSEKETTPILFFAFLTVSPVSSSNLPHRSHPVHG